MLALLHEIKKLTKNDDTQYLDLVPYNSIIVLYTTVQVPDTAIATHLVIFHMRLEVTEEVTGRIGTEKEHVDALLRANGNTNLTTVTKSTCAEIKRAARDIYLSILFLKIAGHQRYDKVRKDLKTTRP